MCAVKCVNGSSVLKGNAGAIYGMKIFLNFERFILRYSETVFQFDVLFRIK